MEALQDLLGGLLREREELRHGAGRLDELERNRRRIVDLHHQLSRALIARYAAG